MQDASASDIEARVAELTAAAHRERDGRVCRRLLALRHLLSGYSANETAGLFAIGRSQLFSWRARYEAEGLAGLADRPRPGQPKHLKGEDEARFLALLQAGPPPESGLADWRGEDLRELLQREFGAHYSLSGVYRLLHRLKQSHLMPRPRHPQADEAAQAAFKKSTGPNAA
jgi:transposase